MIRKWIAALLRRIAPDDYVATLERGDLLLAVEYLREYEGMIFDYEWDEVRTKRIQAARRKLMDAAMGEA